MATARFQHLDALRGLACLCVIATHIGNAYNHSRQWETFPGLILNCGFSCVCLFFILSGFVLSYKFLGEPDRTDDLIRAIVKRPLRFSGVVLFATAVGLALQPKKLIGQYGLGVFNSSLDFATIPMIPLWSIPVEIYGSVITFVVLLTFQRQTRQFRTIVLLILIFLFRSDYLVAFFAGMLMADYLKHQEPNPWLRRVALDPAAVAVVLYFPQRRPPAGP